jgi:hypothetical protein
MIRKTLITTTHGRPDVPENSLTSLAPVRRLGSVQKYPHAPITRVLHSLGWARVCGWGANDETTSTVSPQLRG